MSENGGADVLVVGAGPVGLVLACELARRGTSMRLIDRLMAPTDESARSSCTLAVSIVRPDGYMGTRAELDDDAAAHTYFDGIFGPG
jgi:2-polyprenyl-6-methoxyphenol hydroxylase-like FAD-dependent oxidoreductase